MKLKLIALLGATTLLSACSHHDAPPPHHPHPECDGYMGVKDVPPPPPPAGKWNKDGTPPAPKPCHGKPHHDAAHSRDEARRYGIFGTQPYEAARPAPGKTRVLSSPDTIQRDNYPFWR